MHNNLENIMSWIDDRNKNLKVHISKAPLKNTNWFIDEEGVIRNEDNTFFQIKGLRVLKDNAVVKEQPILIQEEIGYLGIICKILENELCFLMQAKIEPGNVNKMQISPTIQATKSNFTQKHGGKKPAYLEYFLNSPKENIIVDQIQSEQSSRFWGKRNRNTIIFVKEEVEVLPSHMWMTLGQIKELMKIDNVVNMDTRTVLSCIPYFKISRLLLDKLGYPKSQELKKSLFIGDGINHITEIYKYINDYKMFDNSVYQLVGINDLNGWEFDGEELYAKAGYHFKVIFCEIEIEGREVLKWTQPLFEAVGKAIFGLVICTEDGMTKFLVKVMPEVGAFDKIEIGPSVQLESDYRKEELDTVEELFFDKWNKKDGVLFDTILSEEGGRFYHEQNYNVILKIDRNDIKNLPKNYFWVDYKTLAELVMVNNVLNIQLRNLLSVLEAW